MNAEILAVGTELLLGDILNTNAQYLAKELAALGVSVYRQSVVGDNPQRLAQALVEAFERSDMVITSGGLGPTKDDLTKEVGAAYFNKKLALHEESMAQLEQYFASTGRAMTENNRKQAYLPEGAQALPNTNGTAPGVLVEENGKILIMLPGPPVELIPMFENAVVPYLREKTDHKYISKTLHICGVGESLAEDMIKDLIEGQENPTIAPYAKTSEVMFRVTASAASEAAALELIHPVVAELRRRFGDNIYGEDGATLEQAVAELMVSKGLKLSVAESCTGGMLASKLVDYPGISEIFMDGAVTYANESKIKRLGVREETLQKFGAVSHETAREMAKGSALTAGTDIALSTTGIAGPGGGGEKPVGLVYIGLYNRGAVSSQEFNFRGNREKIRQRTVVYALDMLRRALLHG